MIKGSSQGFGRHGPLRRAFGEYFMKDNLTTQSP
jgi:hypothetical protein